MDISRLVVQTAQRETDNVDDALSYLQQHILEIAGFIHAMAEDEDLPNNTIEISAINPTEGKRMFVKFGEEDVTAEDIAKIKEHAKQSDSYNLRKASESPIDKSKETPNSSTILDSSGPTDTDTIN